MVEYIYFVKCPNCEDEHFNFFDEAKAFALGCMSKKPIITQTEVCRNDFGECTDHSDLGTVWSWEETMKETDAEPAVSVFTKDDLKNLPVDNDPEFDDDDFYFTNNSIAEDYSRRVSFKSKAEHDEFMKLCSEIGIITGEDLDRFMVDHKVDDSNLLDKLRAYRDELGADFKIEECQRKPIPEGMTIEELVEEMEENEDTVECTWCNDLFDKSECRKEVDLGWLCGRCEAAIKSRGEALTFRENNYWDFLDEKLDLNIDFSNCVDSSDHEIWGVEQVSESTYKAVLLKRYENVSMRGYDEAQKVYDEMYDINGLFTFSFGKDGNPSLDAWNVNLLRKLGSVRIDFEDSRYDDAAAKVFNRSAIKEEVEELHDLGNVYDGGYPTEKPELPEFDEDSDSHLKLCPECGKETFDIETGICVDCGFN
jgi:hypothetical protein